MASGAGPVGSEPIPRSFILSAAVLGSVAVILAWTVGSASQWVAMDYRTFFIASRTAVAHIYDGPNFTFIYPPTGIFLTRLLSFVGYWPGFLVLGGLSAAAFYAALRPISDRFALLSLLSVPALQGLIWGQLAMLFVAGLLWALSMPSLWKGLVIGVLLSIKPQLFIAAPLVFLVRRDFATVGGIAAGGILSAAVTTLVFGFEPWRDWLTALPQFHDFLVRSNALGGLITPAGIADRFGLSVAPFYVAGLALAAWIVTKEQDDLPTLAAIIGGASLMASPYAMTHDALILMPAAAAALLAGRRLAPALIVYCAPFVPGAVPLFLMERLWRASSSPTAGAGQMRPQPSEALPPRPSWRGPQQRRPKALRGQPD